MLSTDQIMGQADRFQKRHTWAGFGFAVIRKFDDDNAGYLASLLAYYAFFSLFPLLLLLVTVLGIALRGDTGLQQQVLHSALVDFPIIGNQLQANVHSLDRTGVGLVVGLVGTFLGARGLAGTLQYVFNTVWAVPHTRRPGFPWSLARSAGLLVVIAVGVTAAGFLSGIGSGFADRTLLVRILATAAATLVNAALFVAGFRLALAREVPTRCFLFSAIASALTWQVLLWSGGLIVDHFLRHASQLYGLFGLVLGLLAWFHLQAQTTLLVIEADVVRQRRLWPRGLTAPPLTGGDRRAFTQYAEREQRRRDQEINVEFDAPDSDPDSSPKP